MHCVEALVGTAHQNRQWVDQLARQLMCGV